MMTLEIVLLLVLWIYVLIQLLLIAAFLAEKKSPQKTALQPFVSILVAARNEEDNIENCLNCLVKLNYPKEKFEIWVGDDGSTDQTANRVAKLAEIYPMIHLLSIHSKLGKAEAKANVLAQLVHQTKGDYIFVTDADILVPETWIQKLLPYLTEPNVGIVSGTTLVEGDTLFEKMQGLEWLLANGNLLGFDAMGLKSTAAGNNMAFSRAAYLKTGGYENIPFSVTEDFQLFKYIRKEGYKTYNLVDASCLNISKAQKSLTGLLHQRKRWMIGGQGLPPIWLFIFLINGLYAPAIFMLGFTHLKLAIVIELIKFLLQSLFIIQLRVKLKQKINYLHVLLFEPYLLIMNIIMALFYLWPVKMKWKERTF